MIKRILSVVFAAVLLITIALPVYADDSNTKEMSGMAYRYGKEGRWIYEGGTNRFKGVEYGNTTEDAKRLESELRSYNYVCVYGQHRDISTDEYNEYIADNPYHLGFESYAQANTNDRFEVFYQRFYDIYLPYESYTGYKNEIDKYGAPMQHTLEELRDAYVVVDYATPYQVEKIGKVLDEINDRIPVWWNAGYLLVKSPKDVKLKLYHTMEKCYYELYVKGSEPYLVKLKMGGYIITEVNNKSIDENEEFLPFDNNVQIEYQYNTEEHPYILELEELIKKRDIPSINLDEQIEKDKIEKEKAYENLYEEVSKEKTIVDETEEQSQKRWSIIIICVLVFIVLAFIIVYLIIKRRINKR